MINFVYFLYKIINFHVHLNIPKSLGEIIFNYNSFPKKVLSSNVFSCHCNEAHLKTYINSDHGLIITGDLNVIQFNKLKN